MKKGKKDKNKIVYEENPWADDPPGRLVPVENFLPAPHVLKKAKVRVIRRGGEMPLALRPEDAESLRKQARKAGLTPEAFVIGIVHDFLRGHLSRT